MYEWYPLLLLALLLLVWLFGRYLLKEEVVPPKGMMIVGFGKSEDDVWQLRKKEGLTSFTTVQTVVQPTYASAADNRAVINVRNNLFFDFVGMNLVDIDYNALNDNYEVTVVNRKGQQFVFKTKFNDIQAVSSTFFKQDLLSNLSGTFPNFVYDTDWQSAGTNLKILSIPYKDSNSVDNTFLVIWDNSNKSNGLYLLEVDLYTSTASQSKAAYSIKAADFPESELVATTAKNSGETTLPSVSSSSGGLPFIYTSSSLNVATTFSNSTVVMQSRNKVRNRHYYYMIEDPADAQKKIKVYPYLTSITPFVYFNPANGDMVVLDGSINTRTNGSGGAFTTTKVVGNNVEVELETATDFAGMIITTSVRRYRRPINPNELHLTDLKDSSTLAYDILMEGGNEDSRAFNDTDSPYSTRASLAFVSTMSMSIVNSPLEKRLVYHLTTGTTSALIVIARQGTAVAIDKIRVFENQMDKQNDYNSAVSQIGTETINTYQNPAALTSSSSSSGKTDTSSGSSGGSSGSSSGKDDDKTSTTGTSADALSALEKKAIYDVISKLIFSRDSYYTASGYTTRNCPSCKVSNNNNNNNEKPPKVVDTIKKKINDKLTKEEECPQGEEKKKSTTTTSKQSLPGPTSSTTANLPSYETQSETSARFAAAAEKDKEKQEEKTDNPHQAKSADPTDETKNGTYKWSSLAKETTVSSSSSKHKTATPLPMPTSSKPVSAAAPTPGSNASTPTSVLVDSYLRRVPNPNYKAPMAVTFDFSKIGWQT